MAAAIRRKERVGGWVAFFDISLFGHEDSGVTMKTINVLGFIIALDLYLVADQNIGQTFCN